MNDSIALILLLLQVGSTLFMTGVIWFVQLVHYPLFVAIGREEFASYESRHTRLITWIVAPAMSIEGVSAVALLWYRPASIPLSLLATALGLLFIIWISTAILQVPCHESLSKGFDQAAYRRLVRTNWIRTLAWSLRSLLVLTATWNLMR